MIYSLAAPDRASANYDLGKRIFFSAVFTRSYEDSVVRTTVVKAGGRRHLHRGDSCKGLAENSRAPENPREIVCFFARNHYERPGKFSPSFTACFS